MGHHVSRKARPFLTEQELRGVPFVGSGVASAIPGTGPERALLAKERRGRLHLGRLAPIPPHRDALEPLEPRRAGKKKLGRRVVINVR